MLAHVSAAERPASESPLGGSDKWITSQLCLHSGKWGVCTCLAVCSASLAGQFPENNGWGARAPSLVMSKVRDMVSTFNP